MQLWKRNLYICWFGAFTTAAGISLVIPFLPLYIEELGIHDIASIEKWSGAAFGATFLLAAVFSPIWGILADLKGRKLMLLRASFGTAIIMSLMGLVQNVYQLVALRLLMGAVSGYISAATILVATQTPREHAGWALGTLSTGLVGGAMLGPLLGGYLVEIMGIRHIFFVTGVFGFIAFLITFFFVSEDFKPVLKAKEAKSSVWKRISNPKVIWALFLTTFMLQFANLSIEPIVTVYVKQLLKNTTHIALIAGLVVAASGFANVLAAARIGKISDRVGPQKVLIVSLVIAATVFIPQAYVKNVWQLVFLRFAQGIATAGLLPSVNSLVKRLVPQEVVGRIYGYNQSAQYLGNIAGPVVGSQMAASFGFKYVFFSTGALLLINAVWVYFNVKVSSSDYVKLGNGK